MSMQNSKASVLIVEDEPDISEVIRYNLSRAGYRVRNTLDGEEGLIMIKEEKPDVLILDWMLPSVSGLEICRALRRQKDTRDIGIIMLTARGEELDRVQGLESGADDYISKPFSPAELVARVASVLRRSKPVTSQEALMYADIEMDLTTFRVKRSGRYISLGPTEYRLLRHFLENPKRVYSREQLLDAVWGPDIVVEARTVDVHIRRLRKALNSENGADLIRTVRSAGYALEKPLS
jgi:two-component system phosphate regulon response regulator PhoB